MAAATAAVVEIQIVRRTIRALVAKGWNPVSVDDHSGEQLILVKSESAVIAHLKDLGDVFVWFEKGTSSHGVRFILGNGEDVISDWTLSRDGDADRFGAIMDQITDAL